MKNCYKQHGREDLLYAFEDQVPQHTAMTTATHSITHLVPSQTVVQTISNPDGTVSLIQVRFPIGTDLGSPLTNIWSSSGVKFPLGTDLRSAYFFSGVMLNGPKISI